MNSRKKLAEKAKSKSSSIGPKTFATFEIFFRKTIKSIEACGKLSILNDPEIVKTL